MVSANADSGRGRAAAVLAVMAVIALTLCAGLIYLIVGAAHVPAVKASPPTVANRVTASPTSTAASTGPTIGSLSTQEDALANAPMMSMPESAAQPQPLATASAGPPINVPAPNRPLASGGPPVPAGFPQTGEGALGQLAAIDEAALSTLDLGEVRDVYTWAAMPGAVPETAWMPALGVTLLTQRLGNSVSQASVTFQVEEGQIKGVVGSDFVVACVLGEWDVTEVSLGRAGAADCQRMVWSDGRWRIGPGAQPAFPSPVWPGSTASVRAGWRVLNRAS